jgi:nitroreductase
LSPIEALLSRYSLGGRYLVDPGPTAQELQWIVQAALRAPDHGELTPFRICAIQGQARSRLAALFVDYAKRSGKSPESILIERERASLVPTTLAVIARIDMHHPLVPAHEQWMCVGGAITNILNCLHALGFAGKMLSGGKVRDPEISKAFCTTGEVLVGWIGIGTPTHSPREHMTKSIDQTLSFFN